MKTSTDDINLEIAINAAIFAAAIRHERIDYAVTQRHVRSPHSGPRGRSILPTDFAPRVIPNYDPLAEQTANAVTFRSFLATDTTKPQQIFNPIAPIELLFDTGASISCTPSASDFVSPIRPIQPVELKGIASGLQIKGIGTVTYTISDDAGTPIPITLHNTLYVPDLPTRLICPKHLLHDTDDPEASVRLTASSFCMHFRGSSFTIPYHPSLNVPIATTSSTLHCYTSFCHETKLPSSLPPPDFLAASSLPSNLSPAQREKFKWHLRLNHANFDQIDSWIRQGLLPCNPSVARSPHPICAACQYGKGRRRSHKSHNHSITASATKPGDGVSADQITASAPGIVTSNRGKPTNMKFNYCNVWVDHATAFIYVTFHATNDAKELLKSKAEFEAFAAKYNVRIRSIRADNGIYESSAFQAACTSSAQNLTFCAVGGHWQNGVAERAIGFLQNTARTILLHAMANWPSCIDESFWPFAIRHAANLHNASIHTKTTTSPWFLFTGEEAPWSLSDFRIFGSPVYVLHKDLQDGNGRAKWKSRCWRGVYVGHSMNHSGTVALVYNPTTTHVSPQFHLVFDECFTSITNSPEINEKYLDNLYDTAVWLAPSKSPTASLQSHYYFDTFWSDPPLETRQPDRGRKRTNFSPPSSPTPCLDQPESSDATPSDSTSAPATTSSKISTTARRPYDHPANKLPYTPVPCSDSFQEWKRQKCINGVVSYCAKVKPSPDAAPLNSVDTIPNAINIFQAALDHGFSENLHSSISEGALNIDSFQAYQAATESVDDVLTQSAMLKAPDKSEFVQCQVSEIRGLEKLHVFEYVSSPHPPVGAQLLNAIWSYRRKRKPTGELLKYKSRICTDGSQQKYGIDYWQTYAPVVNWSTVRLALVLSSILDFRSRQVDFAQAFPQAPLTEPVYMKIPQGWYVQNNQLEQHENPEHRDTTHHIKLLRNLYGIKQAARNWWTHLSTGLKARGFLESSTDNCLYIRDDCIIVLYTDDCLIFAKDDSIIDKLIADLKQDYLIGDTGSVQDFLGIRITKDSTGRIHMVQTGLIDTIIREVGLSTGKTSETPADQILHPDKHGAPRNDKWNYRSIIGKLNFLAQNTRPDISMAVHNCARFCNNPTQLHETAVKRIVRYLLLTRDKGMILTPQNNFQLDMFVDADFAGTWHKEYSHLRDCVLSRTGYVIRYCGCPIIWASKLQSEIALSTTEAEYIALSMATRQLLPLRRIMAELSAHGPIAVTLKQHHPMLTFTKSLSSSVPSSAEIEPSIIYEDNAACIVLAQSDQHKPRTKHISLKWHHFRDQIKTGNICIRKIESQFNLADILTKPLLKIAHQRLRKGIMGW